MKSQEKFLEIYKREPEFLAFCPYRICPLGAHIDHQFGKITGFAIDKGVFIAYSKKQNGIVELNSLQFEKRAQFHVKDVPPPQKDWADYLRGATVALSEKYPLKYGLSGVIEGSIPIGGLSSSAAVIIAFLSALCRVNGISPTKQEIVTIAQNAENVYVGVACGKLDQSCEIYCLKDNLLYLDTLTDEVQYIHVNPNMKPYKIAIFFSGVERNLAGSKYNMRIDECKAAAYALKAYEGIEYGKFKKNFLSEVPYEVYLKHKDKLPEPWRKRAEHYFTESQRVEEGVKAWTDGDIEKFGRLCFESGNSSVENYEAGSPELIKLFEILKETDGVYGGRFSGAGFKGCCMALINPEKADKILEEVEKKYLTAFPKFKGKYCAYLCETSNGVEL